MKKIYPVQTQKLNVLVLGVGGNVSQGILKALAVSSLKYRVVGACISKESLGLYLCDTAYISPYANDEVFTKWLVDICQQEKIDIILTGVEEIIDRLDTDAEIIKKETSAIFVSSSKKQLKIGGDKLKTCEWLEQNNCAFPKFSTSEIKDDVDRLIACCGFPLIAKPRNGKGSQGIKIIKGQSEMDVVCNMDNYVIEQYIGDEESEYTVACYCDKNGNFVDLIAMKRLLGSGTTVRAEVVQNEVIRNEAIKICKALKPIGPLNIQMRLSGDGTPVCFELNVRFSGTTPMRARFGFNDVEALIREHVFNEDISNFFNVTGGRAYRYWNELYIDESDMKTLQESEKIAIVNQFENYVDGYRGK